MDQQQRDRHPPAFLDEYEWDDKMNKRMTAIKVGEPSGKQPSKIQSTPGSGRISTTREHLRSPGRHPTASANPMSTTSSKSLTTRRHELELEVLEEKPSLMKRRRQLEEECLNEEINILEKKNVLKLSMLDDEDNYSQHLSEDEGDDEEKLDQLRSSRTKEWTNTGLPNTVKFEDKACGQPMVSVDTLTKAIVAAIRGSKTTTDVPSKFMARQSIGKDLPSFSGKPEEWPMFWSAYERTTKDCGFSDSENISRLQKCLKGEALKTVQCLLISPDSLNSVLEMLKIRFGRTEHIIESLIEKTKLIAAVKMDKLETLIEFGISIQNLVGTIKSLKSNIHLENPTLLKEMEQKLPSALQMQWLEWVDGHPTRRKDISNFALWMELKTKTACQLSSPVIREENSEKKERKNEWTKQRKPRETVLTSTEDKTPESNRVSCLFCKKNGHSLEACRSFLKESIQSRWRGVKNMKLCFVCLNLSHQSNECENRRACQVEDCGRFHHKLLHLPTNKPPPPKAATSKKTEAEGKTNDVCSSISGNSNGKLLRIMNVKLRGPAGIVETCAILDEGSSLTMLKSSIAEQLGLKGRNEPFCVKWFDSHVRREEYSRVVQLEIAGDFHGAKFYKLDKVRTIEDLKIAGQSCDVEELKEQWPHLKRMKMSSLNKAVPTILIGIDNAQLSAHREIIEGPPNTPIATRTKLGWSVGGPCPPAVDRSEIVLHLCERPATDENLHSLMKEYFTTESFGVRVSEAKPRSRADAKALEILNESTRRISGRFETAHLWKSDEVTLPESRYMALQRLLCIEKKMDRNAEFAQVYCEKILDYESKGYIKKLTEEEIGRHNAKTWYLIHFGVVNPHKPGKMRLVFDAAAKSNGTSLNDFLWTGPDLLNPLPVVLWKFRKGKWAFMSDIKEMFHQIRIRESDQSAQRFLWRGIERNLPPQEYQMQVMVFGATSSPASAIFVKNRNAEEFQDQYPKAVKAITQHHYMDDYLGNADSLEEAKKLICDVIHVHQQGGFNICNWVSNSKELMKIIPEELRAAGAKDFNPKAELPVERVLGLWWDSNSDSFLFKTNFHRVKAAILDGSERPTKREMASLVMSLFDPLGFVAHFKAKGLILLQEAWRSEVVWDDKIPDQLFKKWIPFVKELQLISTMRIPRCYSSFLPVSESIQLHVFVDASEEAYSSLCYLRMQAGPTIEVAFVNAKVRVAPIKTLTVPRLELQAALMGSRMAKTLSEELELKISNTVLWSDSSTVLSWLRSESGRFKQFVAHRIGEILELTNVVDWRWVPTAENPADEATRSNTPCDFSASSRWLNGPPFLKRSETEWPKPKNKSTDEDMELMEFVNEVQEYHRFPAIINEQNFSTWNRLIRVTAWVLRATNNWIGKAYPERHKHFLGELKVIELDAAMVHWWKKMQSDCFSEDIRRMKIGMPIDKKSRLLVLSPMLDHDGLVKIHGRIDNSPDADKFMKLPTILDPKHHCTRLYIDHLHRHGAHQGQERVVNELRQRFWVIGIRAAVRAAWNRCQECRNSKAKPNIPEMGSLPIGRLKSKKLPFCSTGVDYFGPMVVTIGRRREKRWGVLFTCMVTRAIHLELAPSLETDQMLQALMRFINRRGQPEHLHSDNGTNFQGADHELKQCLMDLNQKELESNLAMKGIQWHFIPPSAPHMGGSWERMVQSVKKCLKKLLHEQAPKEYTMLTLFTEVENIVNSRPITHTSVDPMDEESLTPNHFLRLGCFEGPSINAEFDNSDLHRRKQWRIAQRLADHFWTRWHREYLPTLTKRDKWHTTPKDLKSGDIVIVLDDQLPRNQWKRGIIESTFPGRDGRVRVVDVRIQGQVYRRPVRKLCPLDVRREDNADLTSLSGGRMSPSEKNSTEETMQSG